MTQISVIIPTYKPKEYLQNCLNSLFDQTLENKFYEVLLILNGEKDPYFNYINELIGNKANYRLFYCEENGVSKARNIGLENSKSQNIVFIDDDDYVSKNYLEKLLSKKLKYPEASIIQSNFKVDLNTYITEDYISKAYKDLKDTDYNLIRYRKFLSSVCGKLFDRSTINNNVFNESLGIAEDALFLFKISKSINKMVLSSPSSVYYRRVRENSIQTSKFSLKSEFKNYFKKIYLFSQIYLKEIFNYNLLFYLSRVFALTKVLLLRSSKVFKS